MRVQQCFSLRRLSLLIKNDIIINRSIIMIVIAAAAGVLLLYNLINSLNIMRVDTHPVAFLWFLFLGGLWVTSLSSKNLHEAEVSASYLMLPCSTLEKFLSKLFITSMGYAVAVLAFYTFFYWIMGGIYSIWVHHVYLVSTPLLSATWDIIGIYIILQSLFFLGSIYFRHHSVIKTVLVLSVLGILLSLFVLMVSAVFFHSLFIHGNFWIPELSTSTSLFYHIVKFLFWVVLAPVCWVIGYFRFKEVEIC